MTGTGSETWVELFCLGKQGALTGWEMRRQS